MFEGKVEMVANPAWLLLLFGWVGLAVAFPALFVPNPLVFVLAVLAGVIAALGWGRAAAVAAACTVDLMMLRGSLGYAAWAANPLFLLAWALYLSSERHKFRALIVAIVALGFALGALSIPLVPFGLKDADVPIAAFGRGYWLWLATGAIMVVGTGTDVLLVSVGRKTRRN
jgi:hypothetical protein